MKDIHDLCEFPILSYIFYHFFLMPIPFLAPPTPTPTPAATDTLCAHAHVSIGVHTVIVGVRGQQPTSSVGP